MGKPVVIDILLNGKKYGMRIWHHVPRAGDVVLCVDEKGAPMPVKVKKVVWGEAGEDSSVYSCWVQLVCAIDKTTKATP